MKRYFGTVLFVITILSLSGIVLATPSPTNTTLSTPSIGLRPTTNDTETQTANSTKHLPCSQTSQVYNNATINFYNTIKDMLAARLNNKMINETADSINLAKVSELYLDALDTCPARNPNKTVSHTHFISLIEFSLKNGSLLRDLKQKGQFQCVHKQQSDILLTCFDHNSTYERRTHKELYRSSLLDFNDVSCPQTAINKKCVNTILKKECAPIASYVDGLFEFMNQYCNTTNDQKETTNTGSRLMTTAWATFVLILLEGAKLL